MSRVDLDTSGRIYLWPRQKIMVGCMLDIGYTFTEGFQVTQDSSISTEPLFSQFLSFQGMFEMVPGPCVSKSCLNPMLQPVLLQSPKYSW